MDFLCVQFHSTIKHFIFFLDPQNISTKDKTFTDHHIIWITDIELSKLYIFITLFCTYIFLFLNILIT